MRFRRYLARGLLVLTGLLAIVSGPVFYATAIVDDEDRFVAVADRVIEQPDVRQALADEVTALTFSALEADELVADVLPDEARTFAVPITRIASTQLTEAAFRLLDTGVAVDGRRAALRETHRQLTAESDVVTLDLRAVAVSTTRDVAGSTAAAAVAKLVASSDLGVYELAAAGSTESDVLAAMRAIPDLGVIVFLVLFVVVIAAVLVSPDRRRALERVGLILAAGAFVASMIWSAVLYAVLALVAGSERRELGEAVASALTDDFAGQQRGAMLTGLGIALCGLILGRRSAAVALRSLPLALWQRNWRGVVKRLAAIVGDNAPMARLLISTTAVFAVWSWDAPTTRVTLSIALLAVFAHAVVWTLTSAHARAVRLRERLGWGDLVEPDDAGSPRARRVRQNVVAGAVVVFLFWPSWDMQLLARFAGVVTIAVALLDLPDAIRLARRDDSESIGEIALTWRNRALLVAAGVVVSVIAGAALTTTAAASASDEVGCNGHEALCERPVDQVVFAGSHNAMSSTDLGWKLAMQTGDIVAQLDIGVRALLLDTHYWADRGTVEGGDEGDAPLVIEAALADDEPRSGTWLCHGFCALGASDFEATLAQIDLWLTSNPREVLMLVIQDAISTEDTMAAFERSNMIDRVYQHSPGEGWPTLGELIEQDARVIVYAENEGSPDSWYQNAWTHGFAETPFDFALESDFSCEPNRGDDDNPFFLVNHWVTTGIPVREAALDINSFDALLARVAECEAERGRRVSLLAVDFVETGDLIEAVDHLNDVG